MPNRVKKPLRPSVANETTKKSLPDESSVVKESHTLARKLERMFINTQKPNVTTGNFLRIQKGSIPLGSVRMCLDTLQALGIEVGALVSVESDSLPSAIGKVTIHKYVPFGVVEVSIATDFVDKSLVGVSAYDGFLSILTCISFHVVDPFDDDPVCLTAMNRCKSMLVESGTLIIDGMQSTCGRFTLHLEEGEAFGIATTTTRMHRKQSFPANLRSEVFPAKWVNSILSKATDFFTNRSRCYSHGIPLGNASLLRGKAGTGKTSVVQYLRRVTVFPVISITTLKDVHTIQSFDPESPLIVLFDDIDKWLSIREFPFLDRNILLRKRLDEWRGRNVYLILSATDTATIANSLKSPAYIDAQDELPMPRRVAARVEILKSFLTEYDLSAQSLEEIAQRTRGFSPRDIKRLITLAAAHSFAHGQSLSMQHLNDTLKNFRPEAIGSFGDASGVPTVHWDDIGGQSEAKQCLQECVKWLTTHAALLQQFHVRPPRGILLHGPPGCSKTMLAKALATECRMHFVSVKGPELLSKWVGDSEKAIRGIFDKARAVAPAVLFFDEFDALCGRRSGWSAGDRVISQLLHELDGFHGEFESNEEELLIVAATNRPDMIDPALLRPGRFDRKIEISPPTYADRKVILGIHLKKVEPPISAECIEQLANKMDGFSGADCVAVCSDAAMLALEADLEAQTLAEGHLEEALERFQAQRKRDWKSFV